MSYAEEIKVLHVDDDASFLELSKEILESEGRFKVAPALSVDEAILKLSENSYDVIVSDYDMPGKTGLDFLRELKEKMPDVPFILFTGKGREEIAIKALNLGANYYLNKHGSPETVYGELAHNISLVGERKKVEEELKQKHEILENVMENIGAGLTIIDKDYRIVWANRVLKAVGAAEGKACYSTYNNLGHVCPGCGVKKIFEEGSTSDVHEYCTTGPKGEYFCVELIVNPIKDSNGNLIAAMELAVPVTERKRQEELLRENKKKFELLFAKNPEAIVLVDKDMHVKEANGAFTQLFGFLHEELVNAFLPDLIVPDSLKQESKELLESAQENVVKVETVRKRKDNTEVPVTLSIEPIIEQNKLTGFIVVYKDIYEIAQARNSLNTALRETQVLNEKISVVGSLTRHDVRNKLTGIVGLTYLLEKKLDAKPEAIRFVEKINLFAEQIVQILDFSSAYQRIGMEQLRIVDAEECFDEACALFSEEGKYNVVNELQGLSVLADSLLQKVFYNLVDNSLKHGKKVTTIHVHYKEETENVKLIYEDDGVGINNADKEKLFQKGTRYGLYLIKKICDMYGWAISEEGEPEKGVRFLLEIPKKQNH